MRHFDIALRRSERLVVEFLEGDSRVKGRAFLSGLRAKIRGQVFGGMLNGF